MKRQIIIPSFAVSPPLITTLSPLSNATQGTFYSVQLTAVGGYPPYNWTVVSDSGSGLTLNSTNGIFSGTPANSGAFTIVVKVKDYKMFPSAPVSFSLTVQASGAAPTIYHGLALAVTLPGTGSKDHAGTIVFDQGNAALGAIDGQWASAGGSLGFLAGGAFTGADAQYNPGNVAYGVQTSGSTIAAPHIYSKSCAKGTLAYNPPGSSAGEPTFTAQINHNNKTFPKHTFISFKYRIDPLFVFGLPDGDNNWKFITYTDGIQACFGTSPAGNAYWYLGSGSGQGAFSGPAGVGWQCAFDQLSPPIAGATPTVLVVTPDNSGHGIEWPSGSADYGGHPIPGQYASQYNPVNPSNGFVITEYRIRWMSDSTAYVLVRSSIIGIQYPPTLCVNYQQQTAFAHFTGQPDVWNEAWLCTYTRNYGTVGSPQYNNAMYVADHMYDQDGSNTYQAYLHDQPTLAASTWWEPQQYTSWVNGALQIVCNVATVPLGTAYITAVNDAGAESAAQQVTVVAVPPPIVFNYFISPTGSDSNPGTLSAPWSIASLGMSASSGSSWAPSVQAKANMALMAGKNVGILPGNYCPTTYFTQAGGYGSSLFFTASGTSGSPTYIGGCNASGVYAQGLATFSLSPTFNGASFLQTASRADLWWIGANYVTIDGLNFNYSNTGAFLRLDNISQISGGTGIGNNVVIQNCSFQNIDTTVIYGGVTDNLNAIELHEVGETGGTNLTVFNCFFNGVFNNSHGVNLNSFNANCIGGFNYSNITIDHCTFANAFGPFYAKGLFGPYSFTNNFVSNCLFMIRDMNEADTNLNQPLASGAPRLVIRNNVAYGVSAFSSGDSAYPGQVDIDIYNNTICLSGANSGAVRQFEIYSQTTDTYSQVATPQTATTSTLYNNIVFNLSGTAIPTYYFNQGNGTGTYPYNQLFTNMDYNCHDAHGFSFFDKNTNTTKSTLATWQSFSGYDAHSFQNNTPGFSGTPSVSDPTQVKLLSTSVCHNTGSTTGTTSGTACDMGAWGGVKPPTSIGCTSNIGIA